MPPRTFNERALLLVRVVMAVAGNGDYVNAARRKGVAANKQRPDLCQPAIMQAPPEKRGDELAANPMAR